MTDQDQKQEREPFSPTTYAIEVDEARRAEITVHHKRGYDSTWAWGRLIGADGAVLAESEQMRYLAYDCDTEIAGTVLAKLVPDETQDVWQLLEGQMPDCRCEDEEED